MGANVVAVKCQCGVTKNIFGRSTPYREYTNGTPWNTLESFISLDFMEVRNWFARQSYLDILMGHIVKHQHGSKVLGEFPIKVIRNKY
ncbi:unnamed protein product [Penicillium nalgiovense]|nr:unnamed protein product [Penicillium nalgiovense]CAG8309464.1 unnamed protein product [Penicillium nalgiovense]CAG8930291.1 unnamed protein product [Penicillium nalgiovense]